MLVIRMTAYDLMRKWYEAYCTAGQPLARILTTRNWTRSRVSTLDFCPGLIPLRNDRHQTVLKSSACSVVHLFAEMAPGLLFYWVLLVKRS